MSADAARDREAGGTDDSATPDVTDDGDASPGDDGSTAMDAQPDAALDVVTEVGGDTIADDAGGDSAADAAGACDPDAASPCSGNGTCSNAGTCSCDAGFGGADCGVCAPWFEGYPACTACGTDGDPCCASGQACQGQLGCSAGTCVACTWDSYSGNDFYTCAGGAQNKTMHLVASTGANGDLTLTVRNNDATHLVDGRYVVRVFDATASASEQCTASNPSPAALGAGAAISLSTGVSNPIELTFGPFAPGNVCADPSTAELGFCVTRDADASHVAWFCSDEYDVSFQ